MYVKSNKENNCLIYNSNALSNPKNVCILVLLKNSTIFFLYGYTHCTGTSMNIKQYVTFKIKTFSVLTKLLSV